MVVLRHAVMASPETAFKIDAARWVSNGNALDAKEMLHRSVGKCVWIQNTQKDAEIMRGSLIN